MTDDIRTWEGQLDDFDGESRGAALALLMKAEKAGKLEPVSESHFLNLHCHSFFSFNGYGYSPSALAWRGHRAGLCAMGIVDFDVLDGVEEFLSCCALLGLRACAGMETRVFVPSFATRVINSPGEPGISYHMGVGFTGKPVVQEAFLKELRAIAENRTKGMIDRINAYLSPLTLDYAEDVLPLTPQGNATERHVCMAYDAKVKACFPDAQTRAAFWAEKLTTPIEKVTTVLDDAPALQGLIRSKTMKSGGVGYVKPSGEDFPQLDAVNAFILANGAIPTFAYLDGTSDGEQAMEELLDVMVQSGVAAVNIIPDRNWNIADPEAKKLKVANLYRFVEQAQALGLPVMAGTEMNAFGQRFVDDFDAPEMQPLQEVFLEGAYILHAHTLLERHEGMGYLSAWTQQAFDSVTAKNAFFAQLGKKAITPDATLLAQITPEKTPEAILRQL